MLFQVLHVLIDIDNLRVVRIHLLHEAINDLGELRMLFINGSLFSLKLAANVGEELLEVLRVIHDELVNDGFVEVH